MVRVGPDPQAQQTVESCTSFLKAPPSLAVFAGSSVVCSPHNKLGHAPAEALNNALQACRPSACRVEAIVSIIAGHVCVEVRDVGGGTKGACVNLAELPDKSSEHGRGLYLMGQLMESLELVPRSHGTLVRMTKRLR